jgi:hypothetical protein
MNAHEDYAAIRLKTLGTFSAAVFYDPGWPIGKLFPWPIPQSAIYELHVLVKQTLPRFPSLQAQVTFPDEYSAALEWCLARRYKEAFQMPATATCNELAAQGKNTIRKANTQIPVLRYGRDVPGTGGGSNYNFRSDSN